MQTGRSITVYFLIVLLVVVAPTAIALGWYSVTKNPTLRPLAITKQALRAYSTTFGGGGGLEIVAEVAWSPGHSAGFTHDLLEKSLTDSFAMRGMEVRVEFSPGHDQTMITYRVGKSRIGPYPVSRASEGIRAAVSAYRMYPDADQ